MGEHPVLLVHRESHMLNYLHNYHGKNFAKKEFVTHSFLQYFLF